MIIGVTPRVRIESIFFFYVRGMMINFILDYYLCYMLYDLTFKILIEIIFPQKD